VLPLRHGELVDGKPVVVARRVEVEHARLRTGDRAVGAAILHRDAVHQHAAHGVIALDQRRRVGSQELAVGLFQCFGRQVRVQGRQRLAQSALQHHISIVRVPALGLWLAGGDHRPGQDGVVQVLQPGESGVLDDGFREGRAHVVSHRARTGTAQSPSPKLAVTSPS
jgi:hypothetical protein